ncbi:flotillin-like protein FloA [PVC group bacterium]|nr:flotillin-like protein FloA [PVC group bacterium]
MPVLFILLAILIVMGIIFLKFFKLWLQALLSNAPVALFSLIGMSLRKVNPTIIVNARITALKAGIPVETNDLEAHYLAGGNVIRVVQALIVANKANMELSWKQATAIDLAGRDILQAVQASVKPIVIDCPASDSPNSTIAAVAMDGIQIKAKARVTVRTNLQRLVGGATEETIIARVGEGIVSTIGSSESYKKVLENPDLISKNVLSKGLDAGTAFEIVSIDIADVDVGANIGADLQTQQAEADKRIAQARAESRRAMAVAEEQEMIARAQEMRAKVIEAEAQIPKAISQAFIDGNLGVMDYYNLKNIQSDTGMRDSISKGTKSDKKKSDLEDEGKTK